MTLGAWLRDRSPPPPPRLLAQIEHALDDQLDRDWSEAPEACVSAAEALLADLLSRATVGRESALDLLVVDALVTYAFEAAAAEPRTLAARATDAMTRLAAVAQQ